MGAHVSLEMPEGLREEIDERCGELGYTSRSEFMRAAARERLKRDGY